MDDTIHVACCFDSRMELPFLVLANSIKRRMPPGRKAVLHAIHSDPLTHPPVFSQGLTGGAFEVKFRYVENPHLREGYSNPPTLIRFMLPALLEDVDRLLYLDTDMIVLRDITPLFDADLAGHAFAAVPDYSLTAVYPQKGWCLTVGSRDWTVVQFLTEVVQLKNWKMYSNSGVMVMDLARFRKENIVAKAMDFLEKTRGMHHLVDQDSLNHVCDGAYAPLDYRWNVNANVRNEKFFENADPDFAHVSPLSRSIPWIMHYCGSAKPWKPVAGGTRWDTHFWREAAECAAFPLLLDAYLKRCKEEGITKLQPAASLLASGKPVFHKSQLEEHARRFGDMPGVAAAGAQFVAELDRISNGWMGEPLPIPVQSFKNKGGSHEGEALVFHLAEVHGHIIHGPYLGYPPGNYEAVFEISLTPEAGNGQGRLVIEVVSDADHFRAQRSLSAIESIDEVSRTLSFTIANDDLLLEFRIFADGFTSGVLRFSGVNLKAEAETSDYGFTLS